jgi:hypothetical protein
LIDRIEFSARNLTSNAGLLLLLEYASKNGVFDLIDHDLVFENASTNKIKMKKACLRYITLHVSTRCFDLNLPKKSFQMPEFVKVDHKK